jgi:apolipoprotein N-acyltransferase
VAVALEAGARGPRRTFALGLTTGLVYFGGTLYWVVVAMHTYGDMSLALAVPIAVLLASYLAIYPAAWALLMRAAVRRLGVSGIWWGPVFWVALEWVRSNIRGGFPWVLLGHSQESALPVVQLASVTGMFGLSALVALVSTAAAAVSLTKRPGHRVAAAGVAALVVAVVAGGSYRLAHDDLVRQGTPTRVGLVQGAVPQDEKDDPKLRDAILGRYITLSRQAIGQGAQLVLWPEASTPFYLNAESVLAAPIRRLAVETRTPFIIGSDDYAPPFGGQKERFFNAAVLIGADGRSRQTYRKMRLVPFGEYVPMKSLLFFVGPLVQAVGDFSAGVDPVVFDAEGRRVSVAICYESIYPDIAQQFVERGSQLLATITNDAWFGRTSAAPQHFEQGALRAVEQGRYLVRAANTGISGAVDPYGRVLTRTALFEPAAVAVDVRLLTDRTIYSRVGDVVAWVALAATALFFGAAVVRRRPSLPSLPQES